jgi:hypothetical protein
VVDKPFFRGGREEGLFTLHELAIFSSRQETRMRKYFNVVAIALVLALGSYAMSEDTPAAKPLKGKVTAVAPDATDNTLTDITITPHAKSGETATPTVVKAAASVTVTKGKDKEAATLADVVVGSYIEVTPDADGKVTTISIHTPKKKPANTGAAAK